MGPCRRESLRTWTLAVLPSPPRANGFADVIAPPDPRYALFGSADPTTVAWEQALRSLSPNELYNSAAMVLLASAVSLRLFRFGGIQKMVLGGITIGFFLYVLSKVTVDLSKAGLLPPLAAAALPPLIGAVTGVITLLHQEDG